MVRRCVATSMAVILLVGCAAMGQITEEALELNPQKRLTQALARSPDDWNEDIRRAQQQHAQIQAKFGTKVVAHSAVQERLQEIAERLVAVSHYKGLPVRVFVIKDDTLNAFTLGGGYIYVHDGLIRSAGSVDEVGFVLGHELAHGIAEHIERQTGPTLTITLGALLAATLTKGDTADQIIGMVHQYLTSGYSRRHEREADVLGTIYAVRAGYDPIRGADFFIRAARQQEAMLQRGEEAVRASYQSYAAAYNVCQQWLQQYQANAHTANGPYYYQGALQSCNKSNALANQYNTIAKSYVKISQSLSPLFRSHPMNEERIKTLREVSAWLQGREVRFSSSEAVYALRAVLAVEQVKEKAPRPRE